MRRPLVLAAAALALAAPVAATAHPLGNFTINRYTELDVQGDRLYAVYVLDLAEIPTFQARAAGGVNGAAYARRIAAHLHLTVGGRPAVLRPVRHELAFPPGQGGLETTRLEILLAGPKLEGRSSVAVRDGNYADRIGWREVVVRGADGARLVRSSAPARSISDRLLAYPKNLLQSPLEVSSAQAVVDPATAGGPPPVLISPKLLADRVGVRAVADPGFARLIARSSVGGWFLPLALAIAFFWGAAHALSPGHGKSIITAYLVGSRGTPWLNLVSALLVVGVGVSVLRWRLREWRHARAHARGHHHHHRDHRDHDNSLGVRRLLGIGISGGIIPCPTALVVLLAAISLHRVGYGLVLIVAFSLGLAATMTGLGLVAVGARRVFARFDLGGYAVRLLPAASALVVLALGIAMTVRAFPHVT